MSVQLTDKEKLRSRLRHILLKQRDAVTDILRTSQEWLDGTNFNIERLESLLEHRAAQVQFIERLEEERRRLIQEYDQQDETLRPLEQEIQSSLDILATMDNRLRSILFDAQLRLINNMAFASKFVNLNQDTAEGHQPVSRVVDITR